MFGPAGYLVTCFVRSAATCNLAGEFTRDVGTLTPGTYQLYCDIPDHVAHGMVANLIIT